MTFISIFFVCLFVAFAIYKYKSTPDVSKKLRKLKFESLMSWNGISGSTMDLFYRSKDKVDLFPQPHKVAVITGGNRGIGLAVLKKLLECQMTVMMGVRNPEECMKIVEKSFDESLVKGKVFCARCDTSEMNSVKAFAQQVKEKFPAVHILINNAGILSAPYTITKDGFISQMAVNYLGHFLLVHLLMPQLLAGSSERENARIVSITSCVHSIGEIRYEDFAYKNYYRAGMAYSDSKLAQVMFTNQLRRLCEANLWNVQSHSAHPGIVNTDIFNNSVLGPFSKHPILRYWFKSPEEGSRTIMYCAISPELERKSGTYLSNCQIVANCRKADDREECEKLFQFTCGLLKIKSFGVE